MSTTRKKAAPIPVNPQNKGIMDKIRALKVGEYIVAESSQRNRFYTDFTKLGWKCATRKHGPGKIRVYRSA